MTSRGCTWTGLFGIAVVAIALTFSTAASQPHAAAKKTVFSTLKVGQPVALKDKGHLFEITVMDGDTGTHTVVEVGDDFIVLRDVAEVAELRVPIYAIRAVVHIKTKPK